VLAKLTSKNQLTLPKAVASRFGGVEYFEVDTDGFVITLKPFRRSHLDDIHAHIEKLGITEQDVADAIKWARENP
jgi:hypothetical protein